MLEKELETAFKKELYELALTDSSSRDDKYHGESRMVNATPLRDIIDYKIPKSLWLDKGEKKQKRKKVIKKVVKKVVKKEVKEDIIQIPEQKTHTIEVKYSQTKGTVFNEQKDISNALLTNNEEMLNIPSYCVLLQSLEEKIKSIQMYGIYFLRNQKFGLTDMFISKLYRAMNKNQLIIIDNDDNELRNLIENHGYRNYVLIKGEVTDSHHIALSRREILEKVHTFVLDIQKMNGRLLMVKLFFKNIGKIGHFLVTQEVSAN